MELSEILGKKKRVVPTSQGDVYVRLLSGERWHDVSNSKDPAILGQDVVQALSGLKETPGNEERLPTDYFHALTTDDIQSLARAIASINVLGDLPIDKPAYEGLGELILKNQELNLEAAKKLREKVLLSAFSGLEASTAQILKDQLNGMDALRTNIRQSSFPVSNHAQIPLPRLHIPDSETTPMGRAAIASELTAAHVANVADQTANLVLKMSELTDTFIVEALPEWRQQLVAEREAATESNAKAVENLTVATKSLKTAQRTLWVTIGIAVATMVVQIGQYIWSERGAAEERAKQDETEKMQHEATLQVLREQLSAQQQLLSTQPHTPLPKNKESESRK